MLEWYRVGEPLEALKRDCADAARARRRSRGRVQAGLSWPRGGPVRSAAKRWGSRRVPASMRGSTSSTACPARGAANRTARSWRGRRKPRACASPPTIRGPTSSAESSPKRSSPTSGSAARCFFAIIPRARRRWRAFRPAMRESPSVSSFTPAASNSPTRSANSPTPPNSAAASRTDMREKARVYGEAYPLDEDFLAALAHMPEASGAALGFDRLMMLACGAGPYRGRAMDAGIRSASAASMTRAEPLLQTARDQLARVYGFSGFRPGQEEILRSVFSGEDVLAVMPTGSGKSLCFQLPALARGGLTLVVSPLIALMRDQVAQLRELGVSAAALNSASDASDRARIFGAIEDRSLRLLYVAPERLTRDDTLEMLSRVRDRPLRDRRSALRFAMGPRLPPGISAPSRGRADARAPANDRGDGDGRCADPRGYRRAAVSSQPPRFRPLFRPAQPLSRDAAEVDEFDAPACRTAGKASRRERHHLLRLAQAHRRARAGVLRQGPPGAALSRRARTSRALATIRTFSCRRTAS